MVQGVAKRPDCYYSDPLTILVCGIFRPFTAMIYAKKAAEDKKRSKKGN